LHAEHVEPPVELLPVGHKVQPFKLLAPLLEVLPSGQLIHPDKSVLEYLPARQDVQVAPDVLCSPTLQFVQVPPCTELFPSGQVLHAFPFALFPAGQLEHSLACDVPTPGDVFPSGQAVQAVPSANLPGAQSVQSKILSWAIPPTLATDFPAGHDWHAAPPLEYLPAAQLEHVDPDAVFPAGQFMQSSRKRLFIPEVFPSGHDVQSVPPIAYFPAVQSAQLASLICTDAPPVAAFPAGQSLHVLPCASLYFPATQSIQEPPAVELFPVAQLTHV